MTPRELIAAVATGFAEAGADVVSADPLGWPGYPERLARLAGSEAVIAGSASIAGVAVELVAFDFGFLGGSMGEATGRRITAAFERAAAARRPLVSFVASGGCRMQEGMRALVQLQRIASAGARLRAAGAAHVTLLYGPATGGVWASLASSADVILAVAGVEVAFAGARVRGGASGEAFTAEGKFALGQVDRVLEPGAWPAELRRLVALLGEQKGSDPVRSSAAAGEQKGSDPVCAPAPLGAREPAADGWAAVLRARDPRRPRAAAYLDAYFAERLELSGDRSGGRDPGMLCGFGHRDGRSIAFVAQTGTANLPAGFRTAARVIRLASRLGIPILTLVDTPGAANDDAAERGGIGPAIADAFAAVAEARVPVTTLVIGEGGSGGALAIASADRIYMTPDSYFAVIAPEAAAQILKSGDAPETARRLKLRPQELVDLGVVRGIAA